MIRIVMVLLLSALALPGLAQNPDKLGPGDTVYVDRAPVFYIYGEVMHSGAYPVKAGMTIMQAISIGGGITPRGSENRVKLRRVSPDGKTREYDATLIDQIKADDVIFVKESLF